MQRYAAPLHGPAAPRRKLAIVHLDGVPRALLDDAIASGSMPFLSRLVSSGTYRLESAFWGSPASTPCFQAGLLYGLRHPNLPAYKWFDRELGRLVEMNVPKDCSAIERRLGGRPGNSLLAGGGTSYLSLFRADAENLLTMSSLAELKRMLRALRTDLHGIRSAARTSVAKYLVHLVEETFRSSVDGLRWIRRVGRSRFEGMFLFNRVFLSSLAWAFAHSRAMIDMVKGVPSLYLVYGSYDEVAHRRGPRSPQAIHELHRVDTALEELYAVSQLQGYDLYLLTDHGHVDSAPFEQRAGRSLERFLHDDAPAPVSEKLSRALLDGRGSLPPGTRGEPPVVVDAGNFAHIYVERGRVPLEARELLARNPDLIGRVSDNNEIGIAVVRRGDAAIALIRGEMYGADELGRSPLSDAFSRRAVSDLVRELPSMPTAGDVVLFGDAVHDAGTVGFAWEFGSHGGLTRVETDSVICWPASAPLDLSGLGHSTQLHQKLSELYRS